MVKMSVLHLLCVFLPVTLTAARLDISFFNLQATPSLSGSTFIGGYSAGTSKKTVGSKFQYGRVIDTGTGDNLPEGVTYRNVYGFARRLNLPSGASRPGVYYCEASAGGETERLQTVLVTKEAEIKPERQTMTVGWGDDVILTMMTSLNEASLKWRHNGTEKPEWKGHRSIEVLHAKSSDAGIYECYIDDSQRKEGKHGFMRLIVRDCPSGKWEPPNCLKTCPTCYNGGVCKSETGKCICPPGFKGQQCENACGKNKWGIECGQRCSSRIMDACRKTMYCISDPYGCSCSASYGGLDCATDCPAGKYGSGCTQLCHCTTKCDKATGKCDGGSCMEGWTGTNCNIPTACPTGFYGEVCNYKCHCENKGPCDKTSGVCSNNKCAAGWINTDIPDCQQDGTKTSILSLKYVKVNPGEETSITCEVFGNPFSWSDELTLRDLSEPDTSIPSKVTSMSGKYTYFANFSINTEDERRYSLSLKSGSSKQITVTQYVLPRFSSNNLPNVSVEASTATVRWQRWSATNDLGDGPIQAYMVYFKLSTDVDWILHENVDVGDLSTSTYSSVITGLDWSTRYDITVTLKRPGPKGEGSKESFVTVTTLCDEPTEEPVILNVTSPDPHTLKIDIEIPDPSTIRCHDRGYINHMSVKYKKSDTLSDYEQTIVSGHSFGNDVVEGLVDGLLAYTEYDVLVSFYNFHKQSPWSSVYKARTAEDVPSQPRNVTAEATVTALKVNWLIPDPTNGVIDKYEIRYWKTGDPVYKKVGIMMEDLRITNSFLITNLTYKSNYTIQVQASTSAGLGPPSQALVIQTTDILPGPPGSLEVQEINDNTITITWTEPITFAGDIQNYGVSYHSIESVFKTFANTSISFTLDGNNHVYTLDNLAAGTRYEIKVNASTAKGFGDKKTIVSGTTLSVNLSTILPVTAEMMNYTERTRNTATIKLPQLAKDTTLSQDTKSIDYIVVVGRGENAAIPKKTFNAKMLYHNETVNASYYVAASFALAKIPSTFVLGDNGLYGGFNNSPLDFGIQYYIYYGLRSDITGSYVFYMPENPLLSIKDCAIGKYGPICNKTCHCAVGCNIETGKCNMGLCEQGWSGSKCHIPDFCEAGYYGELCDQNCHCSRNSECDRNTSVCSNGQCAPGWIDVDTDGCQQDGSKKIRSLHSLKVNPGEETYIVCEATANPVIEPKDLILLDLSVHSHVNLTDWYISKKYVFVANFSIIVYSHTLYALAIAGGPSQGIAVDLYDLPRFSPSNLPNVSIDASTATVKWQRWSATDDLGDGPIQAYIVYYKLSTDVHWILHENIDVADSSTSTYSSIITGLDWSTRYDVTVTLKRPGPRGECSKESYKTVTTLCEVPDQGPSIISTESTTPEIINIKIEVPVSSQVKCTYSGVQGYIDSLLVKYREANTQDDYVEIVMRNTSVRVLALSGLFAYTKYQLLVSFRNKDQQSPWSQEYMAWTAEDVPSIPRNVTVRAGADSMTIQWLVPEPCNGLINEYKIRYWEIAKPSQNHTLIITANLGDINTATIFNLTHKAHYKVQVQASTGAGLGEFTDVMSVQTSDQIPGLPGTIGVSEVHENKISVFWTEPVVYSGDIQQYGVIYYPMESIFRHTLLQARSVLLEGNRYTYTLDDLMPGTTYGIQVNASTSKGFGKPRTLKARTSFADDILKQLPLADMVKHNVEHSDTRTTVKLPGLSYDTRISKETTLIDYIIIVAYGENSAEEKLRKIDFERLGRYRTSGLTYYITASLLLKDLPSSFVVGDGRVYGGFNNVPLLPGKKYHIFYGLGSNITGDYEYYFSADTSVSFTGHHESTGQPSSTRIILIIVLIIILLIGILFVIYLYLKWVRSKGTKKSFSHVELEIQNSTPSNQSTADLTSTDQANTTNLELAPAYPGSSADSLFGTASHVYTSSVE